MSLAPIDRPSPNCDARTRPVDLVVLHYTGMATAEDALARLTDPAPVAGRYLGPWQPPEMDPATPLGRVSAHYVVGEAGTVWRLVAEDRRAWHAGVSRWQGESDVNDRSIGIEIVNGGHDFGLPPYPELQVTALLDLLAEIAARHGLGPHRVVGHSDIAPGRKIDPGERFPWARLAAAGLALWPLVSPAPGGPILLQPGETGEAVGAVQETLAALGYALAATGRYDAETEAVVRAFQRRFRPRALDGCVDAETLAILTDVSAQHTRLSLPKLRS